MAESLYLQLPSADGPARWLVVDALGNRIGFTQQGSLTEAAAQAQGRRLAVLVPGEHVSLLNADIPSRSLQKVQQAAPFTLEDRLAEDVDSLHFAVTLRDTGPHLVAALSRSRLQRWLGLLNQAGLVAQQVVPDMCALVPQADTVVVALEAERAVVRMPDGSGFSLEQALAAALLKRRLADTPASRIELHGDESASAAFTAALGEVSAELITRPTSDGILPLLAEGIRTQRPLNLLQGEFQVTTGWQEHWRNWRVAAILLVACLLLGLVQQVISYVHLKREAAALDAQVVQIFNQAMPGSRLVAGAEQHEMQTLLSKLQGGNSAGSLLPLLDALGDGLSSNPSIQVTGLSYQGGSLQAQLQAGDIGALDTLKNVLAKHEGLTVNLDSVNAAGSQVTGRIVLGGSPS